MSLNDLMDLLERRMNHLDATGDADVVLNDQALREAGVLIQAIESLPVDGRTDDERQVALACETLGWFFAGRSLKRPTGPDLGDLARAVVYLDEVFSGPDDDLPAFMRTMLGPTAETPTQIGIGQELIGHEAVSGDVMALDAGLRLLTAALPNLPANDAERPALLFELGRAHRTMYDRRGDPDQLHHAIALLGRALSESSPRHPGHAGMWSNLCLCHNDRYLLEGQVQDLHDAVDFGGRAVAAATEDDPDRHSLLANLASAHRRRYSHTMARPDLDQAIAYNEQALAAAPDAGRDLVRLTTNLAACLFDRYGADGARADVDRAISLFTRALAALPEHDPVRRAVRYNAGLSYQRRYERTWSPADLDAAVEHLEYAADLPAGHPDRPASLAAFASILHLRYEVTGALADLDRAIGLHLAAIDGAPAGYVDRPGRLTNLANAYLDRARRTKARGDLDEAITILRVALEECRDGHPDWPHASAGLGLAYGDRHQLTGEPGDLDQAITHLAGAVEAEYREQAIRRRWMGNLGTSYLRRFELTGHPADLDRSVALNRQALDGLEDDPDTTLFLGNLGVALGRRFEVGGTRVDLATLAESVQRIVSTTSQPAHAVRAGHSFGTLANEMGAPEIAAQVLDHAVSLLPLVASREAEWQDREHRLGQHLGTVTEAIAAHCALGDPVAAAEIAELGRGVQLAAQLDSRTDLTELAQVDPELAARFRVVRDRLSTEDRASRHHWAEHDSLIAGIRRLPGFDRFLLPPRLADLMPTTGAVVLVNTSERRGDAIIIGQDADPVAISLPQLEIKEVRSRAQALLNATVNDTSPQPADTVADVLGWLWDVIVEPVCDALPVDRVWWMPTGLLGLFPLHAAGYPDRPGALDAVVSSYTPTLRTLAHARTRPPATTRRQLAVTLSRTPGQADLPGAAAEAADLPGATLLSDDHATTGSVLNALPDATWAHFACHAATDLNTPSAGGLVLYDDTLRIPEISGLRLAEAELAYLSACSTAYRGVSHAEESINPASAFHLAGFRHVIASLWPIQDTVATVTARAFYRHLPATASADGAAHILHGITRDLRTHRPDRPDQWASLVHSGP